MLQDDTVVLAYPGPAFMTGHAVCVQKAAADVYSAVN